MKLFKIIGDFMKRPLFVKSPDDGAISSGGDGIVIEKQPVAKEPVINYNDLQNQIKQQLVNDYNAQKEAEIQKQKDIELEELRKKNESYEKKLAEMENQNKINEYNITFKELALNEGATKTDTLLKLADRNLSPSDAIKTLKEAVPELFVKSTTITAIGGGAKGSPYENKTPDEVSKMSIDEYKKWRGGEPNV